MSGNITGRLVGASGPTALPVPAVGQVVADVVALRALVGSVDLPAIVLAQYASVAPHRGGGPFIWDAVSRTDDGVSRFNAGGFGTSGVGWQRVTSGNEIHIEEAGATGDGTTNDTAAFTRALAYLTARDGGVLRFGARTYRLDPDTFDIDGPGDGASNIKLRGETRTSQYGGGTIIKSTGAGGFLVRFAAQGCVAEDITFHGGSDAPGDAAVDTVVLFDYQTFGSGLSRCAVHGARDDAAISAVPDHTTDSFTAVGHGLVNGDQLYFNSAATRPAGFYQHTTGVYSWVWYVVNKTDDTFQLSLTEGGAVHTFADNGTGGVVFAKYGGEDWGHLVRIGGASGLQADTGFVRDCVLTQNPSSSAVASRGIFISDSNAVLWDITKTHIGQCVDTVYVRTGGASFRECTIYPMPTVSRAHFAKEGLCQYLNVTDGTWSEMDAVPLVVCVGTQTEDYSSPWRFAGLGMAGGRAHINWNCRQPLILEGRVGGDVHITAEGGHYVTAIAPQFSVAEDPLGYFKGATERVIAIGASRAGAAPYTRFPRISGAEPELGGTANHGHGLFLDGGQPTDAAVRRGGPVVLDHGVFWPGAASGDNRAAGVLHALRLDALTVESVDSGANTITDTGHGLTADDSVRLATTGTMPGGLFAGIDYWVNPVNADDFSLSLSRGGAVIDITSAGAGTLYYSPLQAFLAIDYDTNDAVLGPLVKFRTPGLPVAFYAPSLSFGVAGEMTHHTGTGSPDGSVIGNVGDVYHRTDGATGTTLYVKESGTATTTGWRGVGGAGMLAPGSTSLGADQWHIQYRRLQLTSTQRLTLAGTARYILTDL